MASIIGILGGGPLVSTKGAQGAIQGQARVMVEKG